MKNGLFIGSTCLAVAAIIGLWPTDDTIVPESENNGTTHNSASMMDRPFKIARDSTAASQERIDAAAEFYNPKRLNYAAPGMQSMDSMREVSMNNKVFMLSEAFGRLETAKFDLDGDGVLNDTEEVTRMNTYYKDLAKSKYYGLLMTGYGPIISQMTYDQAYTFTYDEMCAKEAFAQRILSLFDSDRDGSLNSVESAALEAEARTRFERGERVWDWYADDFERAQQEHRRAKLRL